LSRHGRNWAIRMIRQTLRVALIEDSVTDAARVCQVLLKPFGDTGFQVDHFTRLGTGLAALQWQHFDVLLLDLGLPDSSGLHTLSKVVAVAPTLPILVLAGPDIPAGILEKIKNDGRNYLLKSKMSGATLMKAVFDAGIGITMTAEQDEHGLQGVAEEMAERPVRVLVVEDDHGDLAAIRFLLASVKTTRFEIKHAATLSAALALLDDSTDVVLLDLTVPDSRGLATLERVREKAPATPVIVLAEREDRSKAVEALGKGAQDYLVKGKVDSYLLGRTILRRVESRNVPLRTSAAKRESQSA
jgi:DNA-binding response OmpR family regulator